MKLSKRLQIYGLIVLLSALTPLPGVESSDVTSPTTEEITVVALGDSITKGARPAKGDKPEVRAEDTFVYLLQQRLQPDYPTIQIINAGVSSNRTDQAVARLQADALTYQPAVVLVMFGTNDSCWDKDATGPRLPLQVYEANLRTIIEQVESQGGIPIIMTPTLLGTKWGYARNRVYIEQGANGPITPYVEACRHLAQEYHIPLVDNFAIWQAMPEGSTDALTTDLTHPNADGHKVLADSIEPVLREALSSKSSPKE